MTQSNRNSTDCTRNPGSFRDPDGFLFYRDNVLYRQVNETCRQDYENLISSGLYQTLVDKGLLIAHKEADVPFADAATGESSVQGFKVLQPEVVPFISYPYEWSFSQLKDAALTTLNIQKEAFKKGLSLKDAGAYNVQFMKGKPIFIDTLSFEIYREGEPWVAYRQFCQHFLAPLALMSCRDIRLGQLLRIHIDGIPLDLAASLLPFSARFNMSLYMHIILHGKSQLRHQGKVTQADAQQSETQTVPASNRGKVSKLGFQGIIASLEKAVEKLHWKAEGTEWGDYYNDTNYTAAGSKHKEEIISAYLSKISPADVWDLGANDGRFSRLACDLGIPTTAFDVDPSAVEKNYLQVKKQNQTLMLPLLLDLTNPSPGIGWENRERGGFIDRGPVDATLVLALIHHLAISNNVPQDKIASFLARVCRHVIIEFVPKQDTQVRRLLATRADVFPNYTQEAFEAAFGQEFQLLERTAVQESQRTLYLYKKT